MWLLLSGRRIPIAMRLAISMKSNYRRFWRAKYKSGWNNLKKRGVNVKNLAIWIWSALKMLLTRVSSTSRNWRKGLLPPSVSATTSPSSKTSRPWENNCSRSTPPHRLLLSKMARLFCWNIFPTKSSTSTRNTSNCVSTTSTTRLRLVASN